MSGTWGGKRERAGRKSQDGPHRILRAARLSPDADAIVQRLRALWGCTYTEALERIIREHRQG